MFQEMIDDGSVWKLQGSYGRMATALIEDGHCHEAEVAQTKRYRFKPGDKITTSGFPGIVEEEYAAPEKTPHGETYGMYNLRLKSGGVCVTGADIVLVERPKRPGRF